MKTIAIIFAAVLFVIGMALSTGIEQNPQQGIYALVCMGIATYLFVYADSKKSARTNKRSSIKVYDYKSGKAKDYAA